MEPRYAVPFLHRQEEWREHRRIVSRQIMDRLGAAVTEAAVLYPSIARVTAFGSAATGRATETSDVDVLVEGIRADEYFPLRRLLSERIGREVDLHTDTEPAGFVAKLLSRGTCIYERKY